MLRRIYQNRVLLVVLGVLTFFIALGLCQLLGTQELKFHKNDTVRFTARYPTLLSYTNFHTSAFMSKTNLYMNSLYFPCYDSQLILTFTLATKHSVGGYIYYADNPEEYLKKRFHFDQNYSVEKIDSKQYYVFTNYELGQRTYVQFGEKEMFEIIEAGTCGAGFARTVFGDQVINNIIKSIQFLEPVK